MFKLACRHSHGSICKAGLIDSVHLALVPVLLGQGEPLLHGLDLPALGFLRRLQSSFSAAFVKYLVNFSAALPFPSSIAW